MPSRALAHRCALVLAGVVCALVTAGCAQRVVRYYEDGTKRCEGSNAWFSRHEQGLWTYWFPNGERREAGTYDDGLRSGTWTQWYPNGQRRARGRREFDAQLSASEREGVWAFWHENGVILARGTFHAGKREGHWDYTLEDGTLDGDNTGEYHADRKID